MVKISDTYWEYIVFKVKYDKTIEIPEIYQKACAI